MSGHQVDSFCYLAAILFFASAIFRTALFDRSLSNGGYDEQQWKSMDGAYLEAEWMGSRTSIVGLWATYSIMHVSAWMIVATIFFRVAWIQSAQGTTKIGINATIAFLGATTAIIELLIRMLFHGSEMTLRWMASDFQMDNWYPIEGLVKGDKDKVGWKVLESVAITTQGFLVWADAIEYLSLATILILLYSSTSVAGSVLSKKWGCFGLIIAAFCSLDFISEVLRFVDWGIFSHVSLYISSANQIVIFPVWLIWLGYQLAAAPKMSQDVAVPNDLHLDQE